MIHQAAPHGAAGPDAHRLLSRHDRAEILHWKTVLAYTLFTVFFIGWTLAVSIWFGATRHIRRPPCFPLR